MTVLNWINTVSLILFYLCLAITVNSLCLLPLFVAFWWFFLIAPFGAIFFKILHLILETLIPVLEAKKRHEDEKALIEHNYHALIAGLRNGEIQSDTVYETIIACGPVVIDELLTLNPNPKVVYMLKKIGGPDALAGLRNIVVNPKNDYKTRVEAFQSLVSSKIPPIKELGVQLQNHNKQVRDDAVRILTHSSSCLNLNLITGGNEVLTGLLSFVVDPHNEATNRQSAFVILLNYNISPIKDIAPQLQNRKDQIRIDAIHLLKHTQSLNYNLNNLIGGAEALAGLQSFVINFRKELKPRQDALLILNHNNVHPPIKELSYQLQDWNKSIRIDAAVLITENIMLNTAQAEYKQECMQYLPALQKVYSSMIGTCVQDLFSLNRNTRIDAAKILVQCFSNYPLSIENKKRILNQKYVITTPHSDSPHHYHHDVPDNSRQHYSSDHTDHSDTPHTDYYDHSDDGIGISFP